MRILAIDGGGIRGIYAAHILERISTLHGVDFPGDFDIVAGTSTGSILAAALAVGMPPTEVVKLYRLHGKVIFSRRLWSLGGLLAPKYSITPLRKALEDVFGDKLMRDAKTRLIIPTTDVGNGSVHVIKSPFDPEFVRDTEVRIVDAVLASCCAPAYFAPQKVGPYLLCDGGLWANSPTLIAVTEALHRLQKSPSEIFLLSIGTGIGHNFYPINGWNAFWGFLAGWRVKKFISMILNLQSATALNVVRLLLDKDKVLTINFQSDIPLDLDDCDAMDGLVSRADLDFTHSSKSIRQWFESSKR
jgi:uncharacterized protein